MDKRKPNLSASEAEGADVVAWFAVLENARRRADFDRAARAKRELEIRGVRVNYDNERKRKALNA
jgi:hypothetical protein